MKAALFSNTYENEEVLGYGVREPETEHFGARPYIFCNFHDWLYIFCELIVDFAFS